MKKTWRDDAPDVFHMLPEEDYAEGSTGRAWAEAGNAFKVIANEMLRPFSWAAKKVLDLTAGKR